MHFMRKFAGFDPGKEETSNKNGIVEFVIYLCLTCKPPYTSSYIGDQFIEPYGSSGSLPLLSRYV